MVPRLLRQRHAVVVLCRGRSVTGDDRQQRRPTASAAQLLGVRWMPKLAVGPYRSSLWEGGLAVQQISPSQIVRGIHIHCPQ